MEQLFIKGEFVLIKIRLKFVKKEEVKYISHLDMLKTIEMAIKRAGISIEYSNGFNPHPKIVFALPLSVGTTSESEYMEVSILDDIKPIEFIDKINKQLTKGLEFMDAKITESKKNIMALISKASYDIEVNIDGSLEMEDIQQSIDSFWSSDEVIVAKKTKSCTKNIDIRPMVYKMEIKTAYISDRSGEQAVCEGSIVTFAVTVKAGIENNLKPELLVKALESIMDTRIKLININRTGLYIGEGCQAIEPLDDRVL